MPHRRPCSPEPPPGSAALHDTRGAVFVEYTVLLSVICLVCVVALVALGVPLLHLYEVQRAWLLLPIP